MGAPLPGKSPMRREICVLGGSGIVSSPKSPQRGSNASVFVPMYRRWAIVCPQPPALCFTCGFATSTRPAFCRKCSLANHEVTEERFLSPEDCILPGRRSVGGGDEAAATTERARLHSEAGRADAGDRRRRGVPVRPPCSGWMPRSGIRPPSPPPHNRGGRTFAPGSGGGPWSPSAAS